MRALDYMRGRLAMLMAMGVAGAAASAPLTMHARTMSYPQSSSNQRRSRAWLLTHGYSGAKLGRRAAAGTVGLARLK